MRRFVLMCVSLDATLLISGTAIGASLQIGRDRGAHALDPGAARREHPALRRPAGRNRRPARRREEGAVGGERGCYFAPSITTWLSRRGRGKRTTRATGCTECPPWWPTSSRRPQPS